MRTAKAHRAQRDQVFLLPSRGTAREKVRKAEKSRTFAPSASGEFDFEKNLASLENSKETSFAQPIRTQSGQYSP
jgi:hypothetical protein